MIELKKNISSNIIVLDEIQNIAQWERFVRRLHDEDYKVLLSGSNAKLLKSELATHLTGRYTKKELFPFSFSEYLRFRNINIKDKSTDTVTGILGAFDYYLEHGGFPEFIKSNDIEYLKRIYEDIIYKDIIVRFAIRNINNFKNLVSFLFTNFTKEISYHSLAGLLGIQSTTSIKEYISFLTESYLLFEIYKFDFSLKRQYISNKKIYVIDNGLRNIVAFRQSPDKGQLLENLVFIELKRRNKEIYFYKTKNNFEIDFLVKDNIYSLIQVCYDISSPQTFQREIRALEIAMLELNLSVSLVITYNTREIITKGNNTIQLIPAWEWLII
jgi:predicted AAA+ superfamily ATPase